MDMCYSQISVDALFVLFRKTFSKSVEVIPSSVNWEEVVELAKNQRVLPVVFESIKSLPIQNRPDKVTLLKWFAQANYNENCYEKHLEVIKKLSSFFESHRISSVLIKGYGLSLNYPLPNRRPTGDIDIYHYGKGAKADDLISTTFGLVVKQNDEKHSSYDFHGVHVENHATIISELEHDILRRVELFLEKELKEHSIYDNESGCYLPSAMFNAVYLPLHMGYHFVYGEANLKQLIDYATVIASSHKVSNAIDWILVKQLAEEGGYFKFLCCLNGIVIDRLGIPSCLFPDWERDLGLENKVLQEIIDPQDTNATNIIGKARQFFENRWKYQLVYTKENHLMGFFLRFRSWLIWKWGIGGNNIWNISKKMYETSI